MSAHRFEAPNAAAGAIRRAKLVVSVAYERSDPNTPEADVLAWLAGELRLIAQALDRDPRTAAGMASRAFLEPPAWDRVESASAEDGA